MDPNSGKVLVGFGQLIDENSVVLIEDSGVDEVKVRTPLTCETRYGLCSKCCGRDLGRGGMVDVGEAVGVIAYQSIGEARYTAHNENFSYRWSGVESRGY